MKIATIFGSDNAKTTATVTKIGKTVVVTWDSTKTSIEFANKEAFDCWVANNPCIARVEATTQISEQVLKAAQEYLDRRDRITNPDGSFDKAGRWYPSESEECNCCGAIRSPSRAYPYSYMVHCRTAGHVASLYGVDVKELRRVARQIEKAIA